jgi:L-asparaginase II
VPGVLCKDGAEAVYAAALPDGRAVALKISDGGFRAGQVVLVAALKALGADTPAAGEATVDPDALDRDALDRDALDRLGTIPVLGHGRPVGHIRPLDPLSARTTRSARTTEETPQP